MSPSKNEAVTLYVPPEDLARLKALHKKLQGPETLASKHHLSPRTTFNMWAVSMLAHCAANIEADLAVEK